MVRLRNAAATTLDIPGDGLVFKVGEEQDVDVLTEALAHAIQVGKLTVVSQESDLVVEVEENGQTEFDLPIPWPGPDHLHLVVGGLVQTYGDDFEVDAETNSLTWLDEEVELEAGDKLVFVRRVS